MSAEEAAQEVRRILTQNSVQEALDYLSSVTRNINDSSVSLKSVIGDSYRDLLRACDRVMGMGKTCSEIIDIQQKLRSTSGVDLDSHTIITGGGGDSSRDVDEGPRKTTAAHAHRYSQVEHPADFIEANILQLRRALVQVEALVTSSCLLQAAQRLYAAREQLRSVKRCVLSAKVEGHADSAAVIPHSDASRKTLSQQLEHLERAMQSYTLRVLVAMRAGLLFDADASAQQVLKSPSFAFMASKRTSRPGAPGAQPAGDLQLDEHAEVQRQLQQRALQRLLHYHHVLKYLQPSRATLQELVQVFLPSQPETAAATGDSARTATSTDAAAAHAEERPRAIDGLTKCKDHVDGNGDARVAAADVIVFLVEALLQTRASACSRLLQARVGSSGAPCLGAALQQRGDLPAYLTPTAEDEDGRRVTQRACDSVVAIALVLQALHLLFGLSDYCAHVTAGAGEATASDVVDVSVDSSLWEVCPDGSSVAPSSTVWSRDAASGRGGSAAGHERQALLRLLESSRRLSAQYSSDSRGPSGGSSAVDHLASTSEAQPPLNASQQHQWRQRYVSSMLRAVLGTPALCGGHAMLANSPSASPLSSSAQLQGVVAPSDHHDSISTVPDGTTTDLAEYLGRLQHHVVQPYITLLCTHMCPDPFIMTAYAQWVLEWQRQRRVLGVRSEVGDFVDGPALVDATRHIITQALSNAVRTALRYATAVQEVLVDDLFLGTLHDAIEQVEAADDEPAGAAPSAVGGSDSFAASTAFTAQLSRAMRRHLSDPSANEDASADTSSGGAALFAALQAASAGATPRVAESLLEQLYGGIATSPAAATTSGGAPARQAMRTSSAASLGEWCFATEGIFSPEGFANASVPPSTDQKTASTVAAREKPASEVLARRRVVSFLFDVLPSSLHRTASVRSALAVLHQVLSQLVHTVQLLPCALENAAGGEDLAALHVALQEVVQRWLTEALSALGEDMARVTRAASNTHKAASMRVRQACAVSLFELSTVVDVVHTVVGYLSQANPTSTSLRSALTTAQALYRGCHEPWIRMVAEDYESALTSAYTNIVRDLQSSCNQADALALSYWRRLYRLQHAHQWQLLSKAPPAAFELLPVADVSGAEYFPSRASSTLFSVISSVQVNALAVCSGAGRQEVRPLVRDMLSQVLLAATCLVYTRDVLPAFEKVASPSSSRVGGGVTRALPAAELLQDVWLQLYFDLLFLKQVWVLVGGTSTDRSRSEGVDRGDALARVDQLLRELSSRCDPVRWSGVSGELHAACAQLLENSALALGLPVTHRLSPAVSAPEASAPTPVPMVAREVSRLPLLPVAATSTFGGLPGATRPASHALGGAATSLGTGGGHRGRSAAAVLRPTSMAGGADASSRAGAEDGATDGTALPYAEAGKASAKALWDSTQRGWSTFWKSR